MSRRLVLAATALAALALAGCHHVHVPYLPGDGPFVTAEDADTGADRRIDPVQTKHPISAHGRPPCKFGGKRCPPWERAWPANPALSPADKVTDTGKVVAGPDRAR